MTSGMHPVDLDDAIQFILANLEDMREVVRRAYRIRKRLVDLAIAGEISERDFYRITSVLAPQSRSPLWKDYFIKANEGRKVKPADNRGNFEKNGTYYGYKVSGFNEGNVVNIVQIRLWQNCDYVIQSISDNGAVTFILDREEMKRETVIVPATAAHGTRMVTSQSQHVELRMTFGRNSDVWNRWRNQYANRILK